MAKVESLPMDEIERAFYLALDRARLSNYRYCLLAGSCAHACHFWLSERKSEIVPGRKGKWIRKLFNRDLTILGIIKSKLFGHDFNLKDLNEARDLAYGYCSFCDRCSLACPYSVEFPPLTLYQRLILHAAGMTPKSIQDQIKSEIEIGHPYGLTKDDWLKIFDEINSEIDGDVPIDKKGAEILFVPGKRSLVSNLESVKSTIEILLKLGADFTLSSDIWTVCMSTYDVGAWDEMKILTKRRVAVIEKMGVKKLLISQDGCGYYGWRWEADRSIGRRLNFQVLDISELLYDEIKKGKLKLDPRKNPYKVTYHDPCHLARKAGVIMEPREVLKRAVKSLVEMPNHGIHSICCSAGCLRIDEYQETRLRAFGVKLNDVLATGADLVVTNCDECNANFKESLKHYGKEEIRVMDFATMVKNAIF